MVKNKQKQRQQGFHFRLLAYSKSVTKKKPTKNILGYWMKKYQGP